MTFDINGSTKLITLDSASVTAAEIWSRWVDWHATNQQWPLAFTLVGGIALGGGLFIPPYFFLLNGWRVRPMNIDHNLTITGNLFVEGGGVPVVATQDVHQVNVNYTVPVQAQGIATSGSTGPSAADIAAAVLAMAQITPIYSDVRKVNGDTLIGHGIPPTYDNTGTMTNPGDPWRPQ